VNFRNIIMATASLVLVEWVIFGVLAFLLVPANSYWGFEIAAFVSILVAGFVVGYVFGGKIAEESSKMRSIGKIAVLLAVWTILVSMIMYGSVGHYNAFVDEGLQSSFSTSSWTTGDWFYFEAMVLMVNTALNGVLTLAFGFVGLYAGSMMKKPEKS
jgi:hypothetical protein